ncbi:probable chitinase 10 isoform X3 [Eurytemora carolleeae]|uniref:probable chitinase 10 isoform X3 n=1 Tax=Eurytemora carolleeae TaxID=1294199 RepID=UPI000C78242E|nr:probable chitinase 10 isoform X3 [Eurytemora carolleeae]|eukprot:XP_023348735.1 probable chitinase 10 isoform X3 [Eurytemora affinis]
MECENRAGEETDKTIIGDTCRGDSGGGLFYVDASNKRNYLLGITSMGEQSCGLKGGRPGIYSNVYEHRAWIDRIMNTESDSKCSKRIQKDGLGSYKVEDIDASLCSHMYYAFATLDGSTYTMNVKDSSLDIDLKNYEKFVGLRAQFPNKKFLISLGGWMDSRTDKYSTLLASAALRTNFVTKAVEFICKYKFDGLDLFYQYPAYEKPVHEKSTFAQLVKELKTAFKPYGWELTAAGAHGKEAIDAGYDVPEISKYLDAIHLITYDTHGPWESVVGHHAPLYFSSPLDQVTVNFTVNYWLSKGAPKSKLIVGIPTFGRLWKLCSSSTNIGSRGCGPGTPGSIIWDQEGFLSYQEICLELSNGWTVVDDDTGSRGPYAFKGNQWVGYDDPFAAGRKAKYIGDNDLGGAMIWDLSSDDFNGRCPRGKYPMISTVTNVFKFQHDLCQGT